MSTQGGWQAGTELVTVGQGEHSDYEHKERWKKEINLEIQNSPMPRLVGETTI
jgi:hypothetical protein